VTATPIARGRGAAVQLPTYLPNSSIKPDLPSASDGKVDSGFVGYPADPPRSVQDTPGKGGDVSVITWTTNAPPTPMESNALWQAVNKELGVNLKINIQAQADYPTVKLPTIVAGNDLPDVLYIATNTVIPQLPTFFQAKMADLTPYVGGDAIKDYPNLANIPTLAWRQMVFNNAIYGVPVPNSLFLWTHWVHQNLLDAEGLARPRSADEYKQLALHFTRPDQNLWGLGSENNTGMGMTNGWLTGMFGAPNLWGLDDKTGKLTYFAETEQLRAAVGFARDLWAAGVYHPNALQYNLVSARNDFAARRFAFRMDGFVAASVGFWDNAPKLTPPADPQVMPPIPAAAGGTPTYWTTPGTLGYSVIPKASPDRIRELLRVLNWLAAPQGSAEWLLKTYGLKDVDWTPDERGNPILNDRGKAESTIPFHYITRAPVALYWPQTPDKAAMMHDVEAAHVPYLAFNPTDPYYSLTNSSKAPALQRDLADKMNEIVVGRQPLSALDQAVAEWRSAGGDQMRKEFEAEIAAARS